MKSKEEIDMQILGKPLRIGKRARLGTEARLGNRLQAQLWEVLGERLRNRLWVRLSIWDDWIYLSNVGLWSDFKEVEGLWKRD